MWRYNLLKIEEDDGEAVYTVCEDFGDDGYTEAVQLAASSPDELIEILKSMVQDLTYAVLNETAIEERGTL